MISLFLLFYVSLVYFYFQYSTYMKYLICIKNDIFCLPFIIITSIGIMNFSSILISFILKKFTAIKIVSMISLTIILIKILFLYLFSLRDFSHDNEDDECTSDRFWNFVSFLTFLSVIFETCSLYFLNIYIRLWVYCKRRDSYEPW